MDGRGTGAEKTLNKKNQIQNEINGAEEDTESVTIRNNYQGEISSVVPDEVFIPMKKADIATPKTRHTGAILSDPDVLTSLDVQYRTLFAEGGFEVLRNFAEGTYRHDPDMMGTEDRDGTLDLLEFHGMVSQNSDEKSLTQKGKSTYQNWKGFEEYLISNQRIKDIEQEIGEIRMPEFLASWGIDTDPHTFLSNQESNHTRWQQKHDPSVEIYDITNSLYPEQEEFGYGLIALEEAKNADLLDPEPLEDSGIRGLLDDRELNRDGEELYNKVLSDYLRI